MQVCGAGDHEGVGDGVLPEVAEMCLFGERLVLAAPRCGQIPGLGASGAGLFHLVLAGLMALRPFTQEGEYAHEWGVF